MARSYRMLSFAFAVRTELEDVDAVVGHLLSPFRSPGPIARATTYSFGVEPSDQSSVFALYRDDTRVLRSRAPGLLLERLLWEVNAAAIASVRGHVAIHAAAATRGADAVLLPGFPNAGKTTTVAGLVRAGFGYLTDEAALVDAATLEVQPYPRPVALGRDSARAVFGTVPAVLERWGGAFVCAHPDDLRPGAIAGPRPVGALVFPRFERDAPTRLSAIRRADALHRLARMSFNLETSGARGFEILAEVTRGSECYTLSFGNLDGAVKTIASLAPPSDP